MLESGTKEETFQTFPAYEFWTQILHKEMKNFSLQADWNLIFFVFKLIELFSELSHHTKFRIHQQLVWELLNKFPWEKLTRKKISN